MQVSQQKQRASWLEGRKHFRSKETIYKKTCRRSLKDPKKHKEDLEADEQEKWGMGES